MTTMSEIKQPLDWYRLADICELPAGRVKTVVAGTHYMGDFTTAVKYNMDITHVLLNNSQLGKISKEQRAGEWPVWQTELHNPSFSAYAKLCRGKGIRVTEADQLESAIREGLSHQGPALIEIITDADLI